MTARILFAVLMSLLATAVLAHSTVKSTVPANGATLTASPPQVVINFNEPTRLVSVTATSTGTEEKKLQFSPANEAASFTIAAPQLATGRHEIKWRALSKDGHPISGTIVLVIKPSGDPVPRAAAAVMGMNGVSVRI